MANSNNLELASRYRLNNHVQLVCMLISMLILHVSVARSAHPAEQHVGIWDTPPYRCPTSMVSDCPLLGNGDFGVGLGGIAASPDGASLNQTFYLGKMDFWTQQNMQKGQAYFAHVAPGHVTMNFGTSPSPPIPSKCHPIPKGPGGYCNRPLSIPCGQQRGDGCVITTGKYNGTAAARMAIQTLCDKNPACLAYGYDVTAHMYEFYTNSAQILDPLSNSGWDLYYKNDTCCLTPSTPSPPSSSMSFKATQELYAARVNATMNTTSSECGVVSSTSVVAPDDNLLVSRFSVTKTCNVSLTLQSPNMYGLPITVGASDNALWMGRWNNKWVNNDAVVSECAPLVANAAALRYFKINTRMATTVTGGPVGPLYNESATPNEAMCMWLANDDVETQPHQSRGSFISMAPCGTHGTNWYFNAQTGTISNLDNTSMCVGYHVGAPLPMPSSRQVVTAVDCATYNTTMWAIMFNITNTHVHDGYGMLMATLAGVAGKLDPRAIDPTPPCLSIVRKNINMSLGMAVSLATSQALVPPNNVHAQNSSSPMCLFASGVSGWCPDIYSTSASFELTAGTEYTLQAAIVSTRDGVETASVSSIDKAITLATMADASAMELANAESWTMWWEASTVSLGPQRQILEGFWYGAQYMLNCFTKNETGGGVIPGLLGPWSMQDPVGWSDDVTLDYNVEANFYGAASSNHPHAMAPYFPTLTAIIPLGQQRASLESWDQGGHESDGFFGQQTEAMGCNCNDYGHCYEPACPVDFGGFSGIEIPSAIGAFVEMHCSHDSAMRSTAAMAAQPFVDFYEHTMDQTFLKTTAYPYIKEVAKFYASYVVLDPQTQQYHIPLACAQEVCNGRQQGGYHAQESPTIDLAYAKYIFVRAIKWGKSLGEDDKVLQRWTTVSSNLKPYPTTHLSPLEFPWCASSNCTGWSEATNTKTNTSAVMPANYMWPIANFAPIHPTGLVSLSDDVATKTLARNTVWLVNSFSKWHPVNGICLAWPSAARMMDRNDPYPFGPAQLLEKWEIALNATMQRNFWPSMGGGGLEQVGATHAINELLLQSFEGFLRFFPGWPLNETASFTTLRAVGAFLVSASVSEAGVVGTVTVLSEMGSQCTVMSPWMRAITVMAKSVPIVVKDVGSNMYMFETDPQTTYTISPVTKNTQM